MKKILIAFACVMTMVACKDEDKISKIQLLTNGSTKAWNMTAITPEPADVSCRSNADFKQDNSWAFSADGTFKYDHGTLTEGEVCSDAKNLTGNWKFVDSESILLITILFETGKPDISFNGDTLLLGRLQSITANTFVVSDLNDPDNSDVTATFSPK